MADTTAKVLSKGLNNTGITEELARALHDQLGKKLVCIVELESSARTEDSDGHQSVSLRILTIEPAQPGDGEDHLRNFARALYYERNLHDGTLPLEGSQELSVDDVRKQAPGLLPHDFIADEKIKTINNDTICEACDKVQADQIHHI